MLEGVNYNTVILINTGRQSCWPHMTFYWLYPQVSTDNHFRNKGLQFSKKQKCFVFSRNHKWCVKKKSQKALKLLIRTICHWKPQLSTNCQSDLLSSSWNLICSFLIWQTVDHCLLKLWLQWNVEPVLCRKPCAGVRHRGCFDLNFADIEISCSYLIINSTHCFIVVSTNQLSERRQWRTVYQRHKTEETNPLMTAVKHLLCE